MALPNDYGVGKIDGYVVFVPGGLPEDIVHIEIVREEKRFGYGRIISIEHQSPSRTEPRCPHFGLCGGCTIQNLAYDRQLSIKEKHLQETLKRVGHIRAEEIGLHPITPSPDLFFYRGKIELAFGTQKGHSVLGLRKRLTPFEPFTADVLPISSCSVFSHLLEKIIPPFLHFADAEGLAAYNPLAQEGFLRHLIIKEAKSTGSIMCILETAGGTLPDMKPLWQTLTREVPQVQSLWHVTNKEPGDVIRFDNCSHIAGERYIEERMCHFTLRISPQAFFQPNPKAAQRLIEKLPTLVHIEKNQTLVGLYCGTGPLEIAFSPLFKRIIGIDSLDANIACAEENCRINNINSCSFRTAAVEQLTDSKSLAGDVLLIDPPRTGVSQSGMKFICNMGPKEIIYISCNPSTLARDLKEFRKRGYGVRTAAPFDFFPHTSHLETLVHIEKRKH